MGNAPTVLLVDDEPDIVELLSLRLEAAGYTVETAYDGQQALEQVKRSRPDLIILDLMLPKLDGYKVCRLLKFDERYRQIPVLIFTARGGAEDIELTTECKADAYLTKPLDTNVLLTTILALLSRSEVAKHLGERTG